eukprot:3804677-Rhodomonas_salina.1
MPHINSAFMLQQPPSPSLFPHALTQQLPHSLCLCSFSFCLTFLHSLCSRAPQSRPRRARGLPAGVRTHARALPQAPHAVQQWWLA